MGDPIQPEDWYSHSHQSVYGSAQGFDVGKPSTLASAYQDAGTNMHEEATVMGRKVQQAVAEHWRGKAAQGMQSAYTEFFKDVDGYVAKMAAMAAAMRPVGAAMETSKANIQPPMSAQTYNMGKTMGLSDDELGKKVAENQQFARWQMSSLFSQPVVSMGTVADIDAAAGNTGGGGGVIPGGGGGSGGGASGGKTGGVQDKDLNNIGHTSPAFDRGMGDGQGAGQGQGTGQGAGSGGGAPGGGSQSGTGSAPGGLGSGSDRSGFGPGMVPGSTQSAAYHPPTGGTGSATSGPGALRPGFGGAPGGVPGTGSGSNPAGISAAGVRGGMGGMGMAGAGAHGRGGNKEDDDDEHSVPEFLKNLDNGRELFGEERKFVPGGVIGDFKAIEDAEKQAREAEKRRFKSMGWDVKFE